MPASVPMPSPSVMLLLAIALLAGSDTRDPEHGEPERKPIVTRSLLRDTTIRRAYARPIHPICHIEVRALEPRSSLQKRAISIASELTVRGSPGRVFQGA